MTRVESGPTPRTWIGDGPFPWPSFRAVADGDAIRACYYVAEFRADTTRSGQAYLRLRLADRHGLLEGMVWDDVDRYAPHVRQGGFVGVAGRIGSYNGRKQLRIEVLAALRVGPDETEHFLPTSERDPAEMEAELAGWIGSIRDAGLRALLHRLFDPASGMGRLFRRAPAAKRNHHAYVGGLLEHTLSVTGVCDGLATHYGADVDRDLLIAGALLHDIGKTREISLAPGFPYSDEGRLLGHIVLGLADVGTAAAATPALDSERRTVLLHLIAAHQGRYEWQSPREPLTLEALLLHYADDVDAKMAQVRGRLDGVEEGAWSDYDRSLRREFLRHGPVETGPPTVPGGNPSTPGAAPQSGPVPPAAPQSGPVPPAPPRAAPGSDQVPSASTDASQSGAEPTLGEPEDPPSPTLFDAFL